MIQRIQTLYLIVAVALTGILFFFDIALLTGNEGIFSFRYNGFFVFGSTETEIIVRLIPLSILVYLSVFSIFSSIFLFKKRILQIRLCGLNMGLLLGITGMAIYSGFDAAKGWDMKISYNFVIILPVIAIIFIFLAMRAIMKDEVLVKSLDRIR